MSESKNWSSGSLINSGWLNEVDAAVYEAIGDGAGNAPTTPAEVVANLNLVTLAGLSDPDGSSKVGFLPAGTGAMATTVETKLRESVSVTDFWGDAAHTYRVDPTGVLDSTYGLQVARDYIAGVVPSPRLVFPAGRYLYSASPNWAIDHAEIVAEGTVYLRNTGTGNSVIIDGGAAVGGVFGLRFGHTNKFIVEGSAASQNGVYCRSILQGSKLGFQVNGAGTTYAGMLVEFAVCAEIDITVSNNVQGFGWYSRPATGLKLTQRGVGELCSYCLFLSPIIEGLSSVGVNLDYAMGNIFHGGTIEGIASVGMLLTANAIKNKVIGTDFEVNTDHDIYCLGSKNEFVGINTEKQITLDGTALQNRVLGGSHSSIVATAATVNNLVASLTYNQNNDGSTITDSSGGKLRFRDVYNFGTGSFSNTPPGNPFSISVSASPFTYTNLGVNEIDVSVSSGTVTSIQVSRNGNIIGMGAVAGMFRLSFNDSLILTYSAGLPVMTGFTR